MVRFIVSLVLLLGTITFAIVLENGNPLSYLGATAFMIELLVPLFAMLAVWRLREIGHAFQDAFSRRSNAESRVRSARIWDFTEKVCYASAAIGFLTGIVLILSRVSGSVSELGVAFAACTVSPLYGLMLAIVCRILKERTHVNDAAAEARRTGASGS